jgi:branched-chain amino acid transport system substrate-binding protein
VQGDTGAQKELIAALEGVRLESPRGHFRFSKAHNPIQNIYVRQVKGGQQSVVGVAQKDAEDPAMGCTMAK